jgi:hypothetical protein
MSNRNYFDPALIALRKLRDACASGDLHLMNIVNIEAVNAEDLSPFVKAGVPTGEGRLITATIHVPLHANAARTEQNKKPHAPDSEHSAATED